VLVVPTVILLLPVLLERASTISPPCAMWKWAVHEIRDMCKFVSVPLLPTGERFRANGASPAISRGSNEWRGGVIDRVGRRGKGGLRLGVDKIPSAGPWLNGLSGLR